VEAAITGEQAANLVEIRLDDERLGTGYEDERLGTGYEFERSQSALVGQTETHAISFPSNTCPDKLLSLALSQEFLQSSSRSRSWGSR